MVNKRFAHGHWARVQQTFAVENYRQPWEEAGIPYGQCLCGCGRQTALARQGSRKLGYVKGEPVFYVRGHGYTKPVKYIEEDRGHSTPCWIWQLWTTHEGYGKLTINLGDGKVKSHLAHRRYYEQARGPIPAGMQLDHLCRQPSCVNPDHLEVVTNAENARRGSTTKLDWPKVREIRRLIAEEGVIHRVLAERYGVSRSAIEQIASGRNWRE